MVLFSVQQVYYTCHALSYVCYACYSVEAPLLELGWKRSTNRYSDNFKLRWVECKSNINYNSFREGKDCLSVCLSPSICLYYIFLSFFYLPACLSICLPHSLSVSICLPACLSICLSVSPPVCLSICLSVYLSACLSVYQYACLPVCLTTCVPIHMPICIWLSDYLHCPCVIFKCEVVFRV